MQVKVLLANREAMSDSRNKRPAEQPAPFPLVEIAHKEYYLIKPGLTLINT